MARLLSLTVTLGLAASTASLPAAGAAPDVAPEAMPEAAPGERAAAPARRPDGVVARELERALGDSHQRHLPGDDLGALGSGPDRGGLDRGEPNRRLDRRIDPRTGRPRDLADRAPTADRAPAGPLAELASFLLWGLVAVAAVILGVALYRQASGYVGDDAPAPERPATDAQLAAVIERPRDDADELASQGRYADAIHILLLRTLHELASQHLVRVTPAMTSREILARVSLLGDAREALAGLIVAVEQTWFGDAVPTADDYARCRAQFDRFAAAYRRGAGARA